MLSMTKNVLANLLHKSSTRLYPFEVREHFEGYRGRLDINIDECVFCGSCMLKCPSQCITVDKKAGTWECQVMSCVFCGVCVDICPKKCLSMSKEHRSVATERQTMHYQGVVKAKKTEEAAS